MISKKDVKRVPEYAWAYKNWVVNDLKDGVYFYGAYSDEFADAICEAIRESPTHKLIIEN